MSNSDALVWVAGFSLIGVGVVVVIFAVIGRLADRWGGDRD